MSRKTYTQSYVKADGCTDTSAVRTFQGCLKYYAEHLGEKEAFVFASLDRNGKRSVVSWKELYDKSLSVAKSLIKLGVQKDEIVALNLQPCPEWLYLAYGSILAGVRIVGLSFTFTDGSDLIALMKKMKTCCLLALDPGVDGRNWKIAKTLIELSEHGRVERSKLPYLRYLLGHNFENEPQHLMQVQDLIGKHHVDTNLPEVKDTDVIAMFQTSGSTGIPKLTAHSHASLSIFQKFTDCEYFDGRYRLYNDRPFNWIGGFPLGVLCGQTRVTMCGEGTPVEDLTERTIEVIAEEKCDLIALFPQRILHMLDRKECLLPDWPVEALMTGGQPVTKLGAVGKICKKMILNYGSSEIFFAASKTISNDEKFSDFMCGPLSPGRRCELKVVDDNGSILPVNSRGEILIRSPDMFAGYHNDPEKTASVFTDDGWFKTDDIGRITETGDLYVEGRMSDIIISGGKKIAPGILESVLKSYPCVQFAVIVPVSDPAYFQVMCACIQFKEGCSVSEEILREFCKSSHNDKAGLFTAMPKYYLFLESLPETPTGKVARKELEKIANRTFGPTKTK